METSDGLSIVAIVVSGGTAWRAYYKDRLRIAIDFVRYGDEMEVRIVNKGFRPVTLTDVWFSTKPRRRNRSFHPFEYGAGVLSRDESSIEYLATVSDARIEPGNRRVSRVSAEILRARLDSGQEWIEVESAVKTRRARIPKYVKEIAAGGDASRDIEAATGSIER